FPWPETQRGHRRTIALGSGDASRIICSSLIAQAFNAVRYPILPKITRVETQTVRREIAEIRHPSLYVPGDFDMSPYFMVVKPTLARGFNYKDMHWADLPQVHNHRSRSCKKPVRDQTLLNAVAAGIEKGISQRTVARLVKQQVDRYAKLTQRERRMGAR